MASFRAGSDLSFYIKELNKFHTKGIRKVIDKWVYSNRRYIMGMVKLRLWRSGRSGDGSILPPYAATTIKFRKAAGLRTKPTSLNFSGAWYKSMFIYMKSERSNHHIEIRSRGEEKKTAYLKKKYGASIMTLNEQEQKILADRLQDEVQAEVNKLFSGGIEIKLF